MIIKSSNILCSAMINIMTLQDPLYPLSKLACHLLQTCLHGLPSLSDSYLNASAQALPHIYTVLFSFQLYPAKTCSSSPVPYPSGRYILSLHEIPYLPPLSSHTLSQSTPSFIHLLTNVNFTLLGNIWTFGNYQPLPCIIVICIPVLSSPISCYLPWVQRMCIFHHMVLFMWWKYMLSGWTSLPLAWQEGSRKGEPRKATCDSVIKQVSSLVWFILFIRFPLNNLKNVPSAVDESWAL